MVDKFEGLEVMRNADIELQLHKDTQEAKNDDYLERRFLNLVEKCILEVIVDRNADKIVTGRKRPKIASSMEVHIISRRIALFQTEGKICGGDRTIALS